MSHSHTYMIIRQSEWRFVPVLSVSAMYWFRITQFSFQDLPADKITDLFILYSSKYCMTRADQIFIQISFFIRLEIVYACSLFYCARTPHTKNIVCADSFLEMMLRIWMTITRICLANFCANNLSMCIRNLSEHWTKLADA